MAAHCSLYELATYENVSLSVRGFTRSRWIETWGESDRLLDRVHDEPKPIDPVGISRPAGVHQARPETDPPRFFSLPIGRALRNDALKAFGTQASRAAAEGIRVGIRGLTGKRPFCTLRDDLAYDAVSRRDGRPEPSGSPSCPGARFVTLTNADEARDPR